MASMVFDIRFAELNSLVNEKKEASILLKRINFNLRLLPLEHTSNKLNEWRLALAPLVIQADFAFHYHLDSQLGEGSYGVVFRGKSIEAGHSTVKCGSGDPHNQNTDQEASSASAVKVLEVDFLLATERNADSIYNELRTLQDLSECDGVIILRETFIAKGLLLLGL
jgi:serine/threonine protein kinase